MVLLIFRDIIATWYAMKDTCDYEVIAHFEYLG